MAQTWLHLCHTIQSAEINVNQNFVFNEKVSNNNSDRYKNKKLDVKKEFDGLKKSTGKPHSKTIGQLDKPNKFSAAEKPVKKRNDKYADLAAKSKGAEKPSAWKKSFSKRK